MKLKNKIPSTAGLATTSALTAIENKIPSISNLVKKTDYDTKVTEIEKKLTDHNQDKYIDNSRFNTLATNFFNASIAQANLITKTDFDATQNYYIFQPISKYLKVANVNNTNYIISWKSRGLSDIKIESIKTNNYSLNPRMDHYDTSKI